MSSLHVKDPETGAYTEVQPARTWPKAPLATICGVAVFAIAAYTARASRPQSVPESVPVAAVKAFDPKKAPESLKGAMELFKVRGGKYSLGHNDCSTFLLDYLVGHGIRSSTRQTTETLANSRVAEWMHLIPMNELELTRPIDQSVVIIRYKGSNGGVVGHCAVRLYQDGKPFFVHNCESSGLVCDTPEAFYSRFNASKVKDVRYYRFEGGF